MENEPLMNFDGVAGGLDHGMKVTGGRRSDCEGRREAGAVQRAVDVAKRPQTADLDRPCAARWRQAEIPPDAGDLRFRAGEIDTADLAAEQAGWCPAWRRRWVNGMKTRAASETARRRTTRHGSGS